MAGARHVRARRGVQAWPGQLAEAQAIVRVGGDHPRQEPLLARRCEPQQDQGLSDRLLGASAASPVRDASCAVAGAGPGWVLLVLQPPVVSAWPSWSFRRH